MPFSFMGRTSPILSAQLSAILDKMDFGTSGYLPPRHRAIEFSATDHRESMNVRTALFWRGLARAVAGNLPENGHHPLNVVLAKTQEIDITSWRCGKPSQSVKSVAQAAGRPPPNAVKYFALIQVLELAGEISRLCKIRNAVYEYWRGKNAAKFKPRFSRNGHRR